MTGRRYKIVESVGNRVEEVFRYEDLAKHHPSAGREPNREYETINGQLEEVRYVGGRTLIKKRFRVARRWQQPIRPCSQPVGRLCQDQQALRHAADL